MAEASFTVLATGQIEAAEIPGCDNAYLKFQLVAGEDWQVLDGLEEGITQAARVSQVAIFRTGEKPGPLQCIEASAEWPDQLLVWNFPLDITYKTTNAFGWPQLVVSVYGLDGFGRDIIKGYGCVHLPTTAGRFVLKLRLFRPRSASLLQSFSSWLTGMPAEFSDPRFPSYGEGREVTRVASGGHVVVQINMMTKDMDLVGYAGGASKDRSRESAMHL